MRSLRRRRVLAIVILTALAAASCGGGALAADPADRVRAALAATAGRGWSLVYEYESDARDIEVRLRLEDAFRYHAIVVVDGVPAVEQAVLDDSVALRLLDASALAYFPSVSLPPALAAGRWVVDDIGAPDPLATRTTEPPLTEKAIAEALGVFAAAERWVEESDEIARFNPNAVDYRPDEDPFPAPPSGSPIVRYDGEPPALPSGDGALETAVPSANHFRRVSFYLRGGSVLAIRAAIDVASRLVDLERVYGFALPDDRPPDEVADAALRALNRIRVGQGNEPIEPGRWDVQVEPLPDGFTVGFPADVDKAPLGQILIGVPKEAAP